MCDDLAALSKDNGREIDMLSILGAASLEFIGQAGLGHSFAATGSKELDGMKKLLYATPFYLSMQSTHIKYGRFLAKRLIIPMQTLPLLLRNCSPTFLRRMIDYVPLPGLREARDLVDLLDGNSVKVLSDKKDAIARGDSAVVEQIGQGKDIMSLLSTMPQYAVSHWMLSDDTTFDSPVKQ